MSPYESPEISKDLFVALTNQKLADAMEVGIPLARSIEVAKSVIAKMDEIESGNVTIEPPLTPEEHQMMCARAHDVVSLGERALTALVPAEKGRGLWRGRRDRTTKAIDKYEGNGAAVKR